MKNLFVVLCLLSFSAFAAGQDDVAKWDPRMAASKAVVDTNGVKWIDGKYLPIEGRWTLGDTPEYYARLPNTLTTNVNAGVRGMRIHTAGMQFRFETDSPFLVIRYEPRAGSHEGSSNQTGINVHGWDLYRFDDKVGKWRFVTTSHGAAKAVEKPSAFIKRVAVKGKCLINLPAYDGVNAFAVGIDPKASVKALPPRRSGIAKPVVFYGTSITHGASASRPGLGFVNLVGRDLDVPVYNLGFSGSGVMEFELSECIAKIDASCYVLDCLWNMGTDPTKKNIRSVERNYEPFIRNLRKLRPDVPIVMAEQCDVYCDGSNVRERLNAKDKYIRALYEKLVAEGWKNLVYLPKDKMYTGDLEGATDGSHPNDLGMKSMSLAFGEAVRKALNLK